jgi:hypothetical protein
MEKLSRENRRKLEMALPSAVCGNPRVACGKRTRKNACRTVACAYCIQTRGLEQGDKILLLSLR